MYQPLEVSLHAILGLSKTLAAKYSSDCILMLQPLISSFIFSWLAWISFFSGTRLAFNLSVISVSIFCSLDVMYVLNCFCHLVRLSVHLVRLSFHFVLLWSSIYLFNYLIHCYNTTLHCIHHLWFISPSLLRLGSSYIDHCPLAKISRAILRELDCGPCILYLIQ